MNICSHAKSIVFFTSMLHGQWMRHGLITVIIRNSDPTSIPIPFLIILMSQPIFQYQYTIPWTIQCMWPHDWFNDLCRPRHRRITDRDVFSENDNIIKMVSRDWLLVFQYFGIIFFGFTALHLALIIQTSLRY